MIDVPDPVTLKRMERAVRKLPRLQREIFLAARLDEMSYVEIAERTGLSIGQVEREVARALVNIACRINRQHRRWWRFRQFYRASVFAYGRSLARKAS